MAPTECLPGACLLACLIACLLAIAPLELPLELPLNLPLKLPLKLPVRLTFGCLTTLRTGKHFRIYAAKKTLG